MKLTLGQAAKETGLSKATISKALKSGRLSFINKSPAGYEIDPAELFRVFPVKPQETVASERSATPAATPQIIGSEADRREIAMLRELLADTQSDRDAWRHQAQQLLLSPPSPQKLPKRWWQRARD